MRAGPRSQTYRDSFRQHGDANPDLGSWVYLFQLHKNSIRLGHSSQPLCIFRTWLCGDRGRGRACGSLGWPGSVQAIAEAGLVLGTGEVVAELRVQVHPP